MTRLGTTLLALVQAGRGRWLSLALLALASMALPQFEETPLRNAQFSHYQRWEPRERLAKPAVVVAIDSQSLEKFGQWPWPRNLTAHLIEQINAHGPKAIGIDLLFSEPDQYSHETLAKRFPGLSADAFKHIRDPDRALAEALAAAPTTLAAIGLSKPLPGSGLPMKSPAIVDGARLLENLPRYTASLGSLPLLVNAARGEGLINAAHDDLSTAQERGVLRRIPAIAAVDFVPLLSLPLEMVRQSFGQQGSVALDLNPSGIERLWIGGYSIPTLSNGEILLHFGRHQSDYYLSAADVLEGKFPPAAFQDRFVFIGFSAMGLQDRINTPLGDNLPGIDAHVQVLESLLSGEALRRPSGMLRAESGLLLGWGLLLIAAIPLLRRPAQAALVMLLIAALTVGSGYALFHFFRLLFDGPSVIYLLTPVFISLLSSSLIAADRSRRQAERALQAERECAARLSGELDAARRIQMGLLPDPVAIFAGESRFEIAALLEPARTIGGDYYDCFALDERRLCFAIGDVSGKGVPASLFMAMSKTLTGALTRRNTDLGQALREVEVELGRNNPEYLFVTAFVALLDADSGHLEFVCAGHDAPLLQRAGKIAPLSSADVCGPPLCAVGDYPYASATAQLHPGDTLCLFTDGVTEAVGDSAGADLFGRQRLIAALAASATERPLAEQMKEIRRRIRSFTGDRPPHDDLTLLLLRFTGR